MNEVNFDPNEFDPLQDRKGIESPLVGYLVVATALLSGMIAAAVTADFSHGSNPPQSAISVPLNEDLTSSSTAIHPTSVADETRIASNQPASRKWVLGARVRATAQGCVVIEIVPGSAAAVAKLREGDCILAVGQTHVGWVRGRLVSLDVVLDNLPSRGTSLLVKRDRERIVRVSVDLKSIGATMGHP